jgi:excinuclease ABC subunit B
MSKEEIAKTLKRLEKEMRQAAADLQFERAAVLRDEIVLLRKHM